MEECVQCSRQFAERLSTEMKVPVYLYEEAQDRDCRKTLSQIRKGEYEGLAEKVQETRALRTRLGREEYEGSMKPWGICRERERERSGVF